MTQEQIDRVKNAVTSIGDAHSNELRELADVAVEANGNCCGCIWVDTFASLLDDDYSGHK